MAASFFQKLCRLLSLSTDSYACKMVIGCDVLDDYHGQEYQSSLFLTSFLRLVFQLLVLKFAFSAKLCLEAD